MDTNSQLQTALADILSRTADGIQAGTAFLSAQLPDVIQQLLLWKFMSHLIPMFLAALILMAILFAGWKLYSAALVDPYFVAETSAEARYQIYNSTYMGDENHNKLRQEWKEAQATAASLPNQTVLYIALGILAGIAAIVTTAVLLTSLNLTWLQILIAPKIYLIEYAASLAK